MGQVEKTVDAAAQYRDVIGNPQPPALHRGIDGQGHHAPLDEEAVRPLLQVQDAVK